ncbi:tetratricopeptide repeat-containing sensor histidine kinase [Mucilaginibacter gotjawali]|uniref:Signal transduction histidine kinase n=2 Tax=Mucilaginibacter gotjawali TaxID=1550579 RepID=A0A839SN21_9SPHI|nr:ATP-binding protein [Mucilaginibacter gotjawali]MBB3058240.1 signal transduction histidine kinase [Mucilaginibacter gotjawali]BAU54804.1 Sensor protein FixL [Mucilaginibacter gotjawali]
MRRNLLLVLLFTMVWSVASAQKNNVDSLTKAYRKNRQDTTLVQLLNNKASYVFLTTNSDSGMNCLTKGLALSRKIHYKDGEVRSQLGIATILSRRGDLPQSFKIIFDLLPQAIAINDQRAVAQCYNNLGQDYGILKDYKKALAYQFMFKAAAEKAYLTDLMQVAYNNIARQYLDQRMADSAEYYTKKGYNIDKHSANDGYLIRNFGAVQMLRKNYVKAIAFFRKSVLGIPKMDDHYLLSEDYRRMAEAYEQLLRRDSCIYFAKKAVDEANLNKNPDLVMKASMLLKDQYRLVNDYKNAFDYQQIMLKAQDSLFSQRKTLQIQTLTLNQEQQKRDAEAAQQAYQNKVQRYTLLGIITVFVLIAGILLFANGQRKKANKALEQRNGQIEAQHKALEKTVSDLKNTQTQLIQSEKMASLGELTAGIAHEIQNPLNFVNNFSEVNTELIDEMEQEISKGDMEEVKAIAQNIKENQQKISQHGKRADFIVKGMLQHSRNHSGERQFTNINILADEFLKLSYHGLRAKDKSFNAEMTTHFDENIPVISIVQQDIGRVLLNLFNNAFYAVNQKSKTAGTGYKPEVTVSTTVENSRVVIKVKDNGIGIPEAIKEKIMQPFFTTKPTGEGTGLGLSLTYDMVVKGHGGLITVESNENIFTEITVSIPLI